MRTRLLRRSCRVALAAMLAGAARPAVAQPIEAGSQDVFERPARDDVGRDQGRTGQDGWRSPFPAGRRLGAGSPDLPTIQPLSRGNVDATSRGAYGGYGADGAGMGYGAMARSDDDSGTYDEDRRAFTTPSGGPGWRAQRPPGAGSAYGGPGFRGTATGPQYSDQLPAPGDRPRR